LRILDSFGCFTPTTATGCILFRQASLSWLITFAMQLKYKKIVFCGVDLNSPDYFFDIDDKYVKMRGLIKPDPGFAGPVHPTHDASHCHAGTPITEILQITNDILLKKHQIQIFTGAASSALYPLFPVYHWGRS
jgi:hypothetical protein